MTIIDTLKIHFIGSGVNLGDAGTVLVILVQLFRLAGCVLAYNIWSAKVFLVEQAVESKMAKWVLDMLGRILIRVPLCGERLASWLDWMIAKVQTKKLPFMKRIKLILELTYQLCLVEMTFRNENVRVLLTGEALDFPENLETSRTSLIIANHRSIMDYTLVNFLVQGKRGIPAREYLWDLARFREPAFVSKLKFVSWGCVTNMPTFGLLAKILSGDENVSVESSQLKKYLQEGGDHTLAIFPEVNVLTPELRLVQRKLTKDYYLPQLNNVLYPRFKSFNATINCFADLQHVERSRKVRYLRRVMSRANGMVSKARRFRPQSTATQVAQVNLFLGKLDEDMMLEKPSTVAVQYPQIDPFLWDLSIVYYRAKISTGKEHAHVHKLERHLLNEEHHYQLEQITPSFLQMLGVERQQPPILVRVHVEKYPVSKLVTLSDRKLETWLEKRWIHKDATLCHIQENVKIN